MPGATSIEPDIYMEFTNGEWLTVEVIKTSEPSREVHAYCQDRIIELDLNELDCLNDDRAFSKWIQGGGVEAMLRENATVEARKRRYETRENKWKRKDEREFRKEVKVRISACEERYKFNFDGDEESVSRLDDIDGWFENERQNRELQEEIKNAILYYERKFNTELDVDISIFGRKEDVDAHFAARFKEQIEAEEEEKERRRIEQEALQAEIQEQISELSVELGFLIEDTFTTMEDLEAYAKRAREAKKEREREENRERQNRIFDELKAKYSQIDFSDLHLPSEISHDEEFSNWLNMVQQRCETTLNEYEIAKTEILPFFAEHEVGEEDLSDWKVPFDLSYKGGIISIANILMTGISGRSIPEVVQGDLTVERFKQWLPDALEYQSLCDEAIILLIEEPKVPTKLIQSAIDELAAIVPDYGTQNLPRYIEEECKPKLTAFMSEKFLAKVAGEFVKHYGFRIPRDVSLSLNELEDWFSHNAPKYYEMTPILIQHHSG